jgi:hypothetical protein
MVKEEMQKYNKCWMLPGQPCCQTRHRCAAQARPGAQRNTRSTSASIKIAWYGVSVYVLHIAFVLALTSLHAHLPMLRCLEGATTETRGFQDMSRVVLVFISGDTI